MLLARPTVVLLLVLTIRTVFSSQRLATLLQSQPPPARSSHNISVNIAGNDEASSSSNISGKKRAGSELEEVKETVRDLSTKAATLLEAQGKLLEALAKK